VKCRDRFCKKEAMPGDPRCGFHKEEFDDKTAAAAEDLKKFATQPTKRKP
jgi:hypothetical protein